MDCVYNIFTGIGIFATIVAVYHFAKDQYGIYKINQREKWSK